MEAATTSNWFQQCLQSPAAYQQLAAASAATALAAAAASRTAQDNSLRLSGEGKDCIEVPLQKNIIKFKIKCFVE